ncbi:hypothetical protein [Streptomyces glaucescens]|uniref:Uncharacterized protein n=1 Tax=Streptomyces glaucescens TaxID=1907 RepID=A0A089XCI1_STRGA|nr:hypothetical protein [Streptomyces glaucescens]AIR99636.1 hypothetical protein SGLAU_18370 [Streptomyces glaucescens]
MSQAYEETTDVRRPRRAPAVRDNSRHQKGRAPQPAEARAGTGTTERGTGLAHRVVLSAKDRRTEATPEPAEALGVPPGTPLPEHSRTHRPRHTGAPTPLNTSCLRHGLVEAEPGREARDPDPSSGTPVPLPRGTSYDIHGRVVGVARTTPPGDRTAPRSTARPERW